MNEAFHSLPAKYMPRGQTKLGFLARHQLQPRGVFLAPTCDQFVPLHCHSCDDGFKVSDCFEKYPRWARANLVDPFPL